MKWQTSSDLEEMGRFDNKAGFGSNQLRYPQRGVGITECVTADQWLDRYTGWCEQFKVRISPDACKLRQVAELSDLCKGCKGMRKRS